MPGDLSWRLGAHFEPKSRIFVILETFPGPKVIPFEILFEHLLDPFFSTFSDTLLEGVFDQHGGQKHLKWEAFGAHFEVIFENRRFLDFCYPFRIVKEDSAPPTAPELLVGDIQVALTAYDHKVYVD